jgi:signal transduction histidine kinase
VNRSADRTGHTRSMTIVPSTTPVTADLWGDAGGLGRRQMAFDLTVGAAFAVILGAIQLQLLPWTALTAVLLGAALAVRRSAPLVMVGLAVAASVVQVASGNLAVLADAAYVPLFVTLGTHRDARVRRLGLACATVAVVVAGGWARTHYVDDDTTRARFFASVGFAALTAVVVVGSWVVGYLRWQRRQAVQARADATLQDVERRRLRDLYEQEQQRGRIAADMHDLVAHSWAVVAAQADGARYLVHADPDRAQEALGVIGDTARSAMTDVRVLLTQLRERAGTAVTTDGLEFEQADALAARMRASGMDLQLERRGSAPTGLLEMTGRQLLAEALTNVLKHGDLDRPVVVVEDWRDGFRLRVSNAVRASSPEDGQGHGLVGMAERASLVRGTLVAERRGEEWVVEARVPAERAS